MVRRTRHPADSQRGRASAQHRTRGRVLRPCAGTRSPSDRDRQRSIPRLGDPQPRLSASFARTAPAELDDHVEATLPELQGRLVVDFVPPDYYTRRPKACMNGWGRRFMNISPSGSRAPLPRSADHPRARIRKRGLAKPSRDLVRIQFVRAVSRRGLDVRAVPILRSSGR